MKKTLLLGLLAFAGFTASAQLPNGSIAPNFTATDINGNTHTLSEYLAQGKTVIIDISATWCGPCWAFHQEHSLSDLHNSYGPWGSEEVVVLFIEGDPVTTIGNLNGINDSPAPTQGNWVAGSTYPIIDSAEIADLYQTPYFPILYRICPDGTINEIEGVVTQQGIMSASTIKDNITENCEALTGVQNHVQIHADNVRICSVGGGSSVKASIKNYGANAISTATLVLKNGNTVVSTKAFNGNIAPFETTEVTFDDAELDTEANYTVEIADVNSAAPFSWFLNSQPIDAIAAAETPNNIQIDVHTDNYPGEMSWNLKASDGTVVYTGGPYQGMPGGAAGGADANTTKTHFVTLPEGSDCFSIELLDSYGDGWGLGTTEHGIDIITHEGHAERLHVGNFGANMEVESLFSSNGTLATPTVQAKKFSIYPNPSNGIFNFTTLEPVDVTVMDMTGKTVHTAKGINDGGSINLGQLQKGMYIAKISGAEFERTEKIIIK